MARLELYLFFVTLMKNFRFSSYSGAQQMDLTGDLGLVVEPRALWSIVKKRRA